MSKQGLFITVEGGEGVGKSTNIAVIEEFLQVNDIDYVLTREPGGTNLAEKIRSLILEQHDEAMDATTELLLVFAARAQHLSMKVKPQLAAGKWVLCDRFTDATYAYQGAGRELGTELISQLESLVQGSLRPDLTIVLDLDPEVGLERASRRGELDRIEREKMEFFHRVRDCYLDIASRDSNRCAVVDASQPKEQVREALLNILSNKLVSYLNE